MAGRRIDVLVGSAATALGVVVALSMDLGAASVAGAGIVFGALGVVRRHPRAAWIAAVAGLAISIPGGMVGGAELLAGVYAFAAARTERLVPAVLAGAGLLGALEVEIALTGDFGMPAVLLVGTGWTAGRALREREIVAAQLAERVSELEEEREAHAALSVRYERARIASELHDIVAHAISVMVVQASAGQRLAAADPDGTDATFAAIAGAARQAEDDMGRLVALLDDGSVATVTPDLALVEELVTRAAGSGLDVTLRLEGDRDGLPPAVAETAYHVVQEGLTNALRYAAGARVAVALYGGPRELVVEVCNPPASGHAALAGAGSGTGLQGLRERVGRCSGALEAGRTADGGWRLRAALPRRV
jgi:signal transduction histidine kinase